MVRCGSIYDNYNCDTSTLFDPLPEEDEADEENSVVLHIEDDDTIENDIQGTSFSNRRPKVLFLIKVHYTDNYRSRFSARVVTCSVLL